MQMVRCYPKIPGKFIPEHRNVQTNHPAGFCTSSDEFPLKLLKVTNSKFSQTEFKDISSVILMQTVRCYPKMPGKFIPEHRNVQTNHPAGFCTSSDEFPLKLLNVTNSKFSQTEFKYISSVILMQTVRCYPKMPGKFIPEHRNVQTNHPAGFCTSSDEFPLKLLKVTNSKFSQTEVKYNSSVILMQTVRCYPKMPGKFIPEHRNVQTNHPAGFC